MIYLSNDNKNGSMYILNITYSKYNSMVYMRKNFKVVLKIKLRFLTHSWFKGIYLKFNYLLKQRKTNLNLIKFRTSTLSTCLSLYLTLYLPLSLSISLSLSFSLSFPSPSRCLCPSLSLFISCFWIYQCEARETESRGKCRTRTRSWKRLQFIRVSKAIWFIQ